MKFNLRMLANGFELSGQGYGYSKSIRHASLVRCSEWLGSTIGQEYQLHAGKCAEYDQTISCGMEQHCSP